MPAPRLDTLQTSAMRIATYNIWNSPSNWDQRRYAIADELNHIEADFIALQEAPNQATPSQTLADFLRSETQFDQVNYALEPVVGEGDWPEGLVVLSHSSVEQSIANWKRDFNTHNSWALTSVFSWNDLRISVTNVHLDWESQESRRSAMAHTVEHMIAPTSCDIDFILGDFNDESDVCEFPALNSADSGWRDPVAEWYTINGLNEPPTIDPHTNPRWANDETKEDPLRFDRIFVRLNATSLTCSVTSAGIFGKTPNNRYGIVASDHYGVVVDVEFK